MRSWDIEINYGIKTGFNEAFIITGAKRAELIAKDPKSEEIIRPILRGRDIKRYASQFADLWILYIPWHFPLHRDPSVNGASERAEAAFRTNYPAIYEHLSCYKTELSNRNRAETGIRYEWYALQRWGANYSEDFSRPKIIWIELTDRPNFFLDEHGYFINNTVFFISGRRLPYLLSFLNSRLCTWYLTKIAATSGVGTTRWIKMYVEQICIPQDVPEDVEARIGSLVLKVQESKEMQIDTGRLEAKIEREIFALFDLSEDEIDTITSASKTR